MMMPRDAEPVAQQPPPCCTCRTCRPFSPGDPGSMRMVLCATCGNKRCPHATDHRNACTNSNEPGQPGSSYAAAPQPEAPTLADDYDALMLSRLRASVGDSVMSWAGRRIESDARVISENCAELARLYAGRNELQAELAASRERERAFQASIRDLFRAIDWPDGGDLDGFAFQEWAEKHGFLRAEQRPSFCGEHCWCAEYHGDPEGGFICYRRIEWLATPDSAASPTGGEG